MPRWTMALADDPETAAPEDAPTEDTPPPTAASNRFHALMVVEDAWSGDYRFINAGALTWRDLPLPLSASDMDAHSDQDSAGPLIGHFDRIERVGNEIHGYGSFISDPDEEAARLIAMVQSGELRWFSVAMDDVVAELLLDMGPAGEGEEESVPEDEDMMDLFGPPDGPKEEIDGHEYVVMPLPTDRFRITQARLMGGQALLFPAFQESIIEPEAAATDEETEAALVAAAVPVSPPRSWFEDPQLDRVTALEISDEGEVTAHLAAWNSCHIGMPGCTPPPRSMANYAHFMTGMIKTAEGERVPVGQIALKGGHADMHLNARQAAQHYDDTNSAWCDVAVGEDEHGIWIHGALRPGLDPAKVRVAMAHDISGDWRSIGGKLELIGICSVNVPGFHKPRMVTYTKQGLAASAVMAQPLLALAKSERLQRRAVERIAASVGRSHAQRRAALHARVHAGSN